MASDNIDKSASLRVLGRFSEEIRDWGSRILIQFGNSDYSHFCVYSPTTSFEVTISEFMPCRNSKQSKQEILSKEIVSVPK
jgi:hypothetical protein